MNKRVPIGCVHGRFQPPHKGHRMYILKAKELCDFLWIGITQPDIRQLAPSPTAGHRADVNCNPFTYFERTQLLSAILLSDGLSRGEFGFTPFPIDHPERLADYMPTSVTCFTTICEPWNQKKIDILRELGYEPVVVWQGEKRFEGTIIRDCLRRGDPTWMEMVPTVTVPIIEGLNIAARLGRDDCE